MSCLQMEYEITSMRGKETEKREKKSQNLINNIKIAAVVFHSCICESFAAFCNMSNESFEMKMHFIKTQLTHSHALEIEQLTIDAAPFDQRLCMSCTNCVLKFIGPTCRRFGHLNVIKTIEYCVAKKITRCTSHRPVPQIL